MNARALDAAVAAAKLADLEYMRSSKPRPAWQSVPEQQVRRLLQGALDAGAMLLVVHEDATEEGRRFEFDPDEASNVWTDRP